MSSSLTCAPETHSGVVGMEVGGAELGGGWVCELVKAMGYGLSKGKARGFVEMWVTDGQFP